MSAVGRSVVVMRMVGLADGRDHPHEGGFLRSWDLDARHGLGEAAWTADVRQAYRFPDAAEAMRVWRKASKVRPLRDDGLPNRPLTAFTIEILSLDAALKEA